MSQLFRRTALLACTTGAILGLGACASGAAHDPATKGASPAAATGSSASPIPGPAAGTDGLPNGDKLNAMLLQAAALPPTLRLDATGTKSTGNGFNPPLAPSAVPASEACTMLGGTAWIRVAGIEGASFAQNDYMDDSQNMFAQELNAFRGGDAQKAMAGLKQAVTGCHSFTEEQNGQKFAVTAALKDLPGVGDEAFQATLTSPDWTGGTTLVAARVGSVVVTTLYNDQKSTGAAGVDLTKALVKNVAAAH
ncbi:hypothetical protein [Kitasatospora terrestris]|uniref:PknH-like extracellular domain-containing protein n=1 Tax=Kitasatospora terrestris TaxID=258051 RepID=A0ABP9EMZ6_9ACTN